MKANKLVLVVSIFCLLVNTYSPAVAQASMKQQVDAFLKRKSVMAKGHKFIVKMRGPQGVVLTTWDTLNGMSNKKMQAKAIEISNLLFRKFRNLASVAMIFANQTNRNSYRRIVVSRDNIKLHAQGKLTTEQLYSRCTVCKTTKPGKKRSKASTTRKTDVDKSMDKLRKQK